MMDEVRGGKGRLVQRRKVRSDGWTQRKRQLFLEELAASCSLTRAAMAVGMSSFAEKSLRRRDPEFAAAVAAALEEGYQNLEFQLLERALAADSAEGWGRYAPDDAMPAADTGDGLPRPLEPLTDEMRLHLLRLRGADHRKKSLRPAVASEAEVEMALFKQLERIGRHHRKRPAEDATVRPGADGAEGKE